MFDNQGWVSLHRKIQEKGWYKKSDYVHLWIHLLMKANHQGKEFLWNGETIMLERGQMITGRKQLSSETGISESKVERILKCFKNEQQIEQQTTNKFRLITVKNYDEYQKSEQQIEQQVNNNWTTSEQQLDTNNNNNNYNNENNDNKHGELSSQVKQVFDVFYHSINPSINYGNNTSRNAAEWMIKKWGIASVLAAANYACEIHGGQYAPTITTPYQLKEKMSALKAYKEKQDNKSNAITVI